jgi:antitoxin component YwqK of YwqJK toxin-antitoxin module
MTMKPTKFQVLKYTCTKLVLMLLLVSQAKSQVIFLATDTLVLEVGSGIDYGPNGKNGEWEYPFNNDPRNNVIFKATFKDNILNGPLKAFWPNGTRRAFITFDNGNKVGEALYYTREGWLQYRITYVNDTLHGPCTEYFKDGAKMKELSFRNGVLHGVCRAYKGDKNGTLIAQGEFFEGVPQGIYTAWLDNKQKVVEVFKDGYPQESQKTFLSDNLVSELLLDKSKQEYSQIVTYKNGVKASTQPVPAALKKNFVYGKHLYLSPAFR